MGEVPLRNPDRDMASDLRQALTAVYDEAAYDLSIDYEQIPPRLYQKQKN